MRDNRMFVTALLIISFILILWTEFSFAGEPVHIEYSTKNNGLMEIKIAINNPHIKGLILKAKLPEGVKLVDARPRARGTKDGTIKWFLDARSKQSITVFATFNKRLRHSDLTVMAMFKLPGRPGMISVQAK